MPKSLSRKKIQKDNSDTDSKRLKERLSVLLTCTVFQPTTNAARKILFLPKWYKSIF